MFTISEEIHVLKWTRKWIASGKFLMFVLITFSNIMFIEWLEKCRGRHTEDWELMKISQATPHRNKRRNRSLSLFVGGSFNKLFVVLIKLRLYDFNWQRDSRKEFIGPASWSSGQGMGHRTLNSQHSPERIPGPPQPSQWGQLEILDWFRVGTSLCHGDWLRLKINKIKMTDRCDQKWLKSSLNYWMVN